MKNTQLEQKPRAVPYSSEKKQHLDQPHIRERRFTDVFSRRPKVTKKDASTNTTPLDETYARPTVPPALPPKMNNYCLNEALNKVEVSSEDVYNDLSLERSMNVESDLWITKQTHELPNQEAARKENDEDSDEDTEEDGDVDGSTKTAMTHSRNTSGWSLGSFHIGPPVELMNEVLTGEEWARFLENNLILPHDVTLSASEKPEQTKLEMPNDAAEDGESAEEESKSIGRRVEDIIKTVKIVEEKVETPEVLKEEPEPPHLLPPKLTPSSSAGIDKRFRSSVFYRYKLSPPGQEPPPETPKYSTLEKIKAKLRKSSV